MASPSLIEIAQDSADVLKEIRARLPEITPLVEAGRAALAEADELLREDTDAADILLAGAFALVPERADRLPEATIGAAAMFVNGLLSEAPLLPGAVSAAGPVIASVFTLAVQPPVAAPLHDALHDLMVCFDSQEDDDEWTAWSEHKDRVVDAAGEALLRLKAAVWKALEADRVCLVESPREGVQREVMHMVRTAIEEVDQALKALSGMRDAIADEEAVIRKAIRRFVDPASERGHDHDDPSAATPS